MEVFSSLINYQHYVRCSYFFVCGFYLLYLHFLFQPHITVKENFDELLFKPDHPGRSRTDTFYFDQNNLLRTHTSAHQNKVRRSTSFYIQVLRDLTRLWSIRSEIYLYSSLLSPSLLILSPFRCETVSP